MISKDTRELDVVVTRVILPREEFSDGRDRWTVMLTNQGKCCGMMSFYPKTGTRLSLVGSAEAWHGELNFRFRKVKHNAPIDKHALLVYAGSLSKGVGEKACAKIWAQYGAEWELHLQDMAPSWGNSLTRTLNELHANEGRLEVISYMISIGGTPKMAEQAYLKWGDGAIATIKNDPYVLATLPGVGFKTVDTRIAPSFGIDQRDIRRALAGIDYAISNAMEESGNSILPRNCVYDAVKELGIQRNVAALAMARLVHSGRIVYVGLDDITTSSVVKMEGDFARYVADHTRAVDPVREIVGSGVELDASQRDAVYAAMVNHGLTIINGGAGSGKTTIIKAIAETLERNGSVVSLCAFAGKAAARLREATGHAASTIHSMLGWCGDGMGFRPGNLHGRTVIVDEASMIPSALLYEITKRDPERLILVGDQAQLQPVGIGSPFHDAIDHLDKVVHTLTTCYRNKEAVFCAADKIRNGMVPRSQKTAEEEFDVQVFSKPEQIHRIIVDMVDCKMIDFGQDVVLAARNGDGDDAAPATVKALNDDIQAIVNPHAEGERFRAGDRVMCTKNCKDLDIWNGTTGTISRVDIDGKAWFRTDDGDEVRLSDPEVVKSIVPAYCITVHKAQGSQYRNVFIACCNRDKARLMDRSMLYTAVTRARHGCHVICDGCVPDIVQAVRRRRTYLQQIFTGVE